MKRQIETRLHGEAGCILSDCEQYRYRMRFGITCEY